MILVDDATVEFHLPNGAAVVIGITLHEIRHLLTSERHALSRIRQRDFQRLHAGILDLILDYPAVFHGALSNGGVLQEFGLDPRINPFDIERQRPVTLQQAIRQHALVADTGRFWVEL